jgi:hypothetical protein
MDITIGILLRKEESGERGSVMGSTRTGDASTVEAGKR